MSKHERRKTKSGFRIRKQKELFLHSNMIGWFSMSNQIQMKKINK